MAKSLRNSRGDRFKSTQALPAQRCLLLKAHRAGDFA
jgi:hypothetical protein